jgi:hypothetical protein
MSKALKKSAGKQGLWVVIIVLVILLIIIVPIFLNSNHAFITANAIEDINETYILNGWAPGIAYLIPPSG